MALSTYALVTADELKEYVSAAGESKITVLQGIVNRVSDEIELFLGRQIVTRGNLTEYHSPGQDTCELLTLERPIIAVTSIHEDIGAPRAYGASSLLVNDVDYQVMKQPRGILRRLQGLGMPIYWAPGLRTVKVVYSAGYANSAAVPARIKTVALRYAALIWSEFKRQDFGVSGASDTLGNWTRFAPAQLTAEMKAALADERRYAHPTGERDA